MAFDPVAYGQMLDQALGYSRQGPPETGGGMTQIPSHEINAPPQFGEGPRTAKLPAVGSSMPVSQQRTIDGAPAGPGATVAPQGAADGGGAPGRIQAQPPFKIQYKKGALDSVKTVGDVVNAMKPASQRKYMDWWEQQYGSINERYNSLQQQLGRRPDADGDLSKKDQWRMLMEFGIELMARSGRGEQGAGGTSFASAYGRAKDRQAGRALEHDARSAAVHKARGEELKQIGSYGEALKGQSDIDQNEVQMEEARARMKKAGRRTPEIISADQGTYDYDPETRETTPITGIDGKPLTNLQVGRRGGSAAGRDSRTANEKNIEDLMDRGVPEQLALDIVYRRVRDPQKAWQDIYRDRRRQYASEEEARKEADDIMERFYGDDWERKPTNAKIDKADPLGLRD